MIPDVFVGKDGRARCGWVGTKNVDLFQYHDEVWGTRTFDQSALFEALTLGVFEVGLSWSIVFAKRGGFHNAFHAFDAAKVAAMGPREVDRLVGDATIIRNRRKIEATITNAQAIIGSSPDLPSLARSYVVERKRAPRASEVPTSTRAAESFAKQLKAQGYRFVGPTSVYAFMQNVGLVNDHVRGCWRAVA